VFAVDLQGRSIDQTAVAFDAADGTVDVASTALHHAYSVGEERTRATFLIE
jgi:hypothetical protein